MTHGEQQAERLHEIFPVTTARLRLRLFEPGDLDDLLRIQSDPELVRYVPFDVRSRAEVEDALGQRLASPAMDGDEQVLRLVIERLDDVFVGELTFFLRSVQHRQGEVGFMLATEQQGQGYGTEATAELLRLGFDWLGLHRIAGICDPRNGPSGALMERLGMRREAHFREFEWFKGEWGDVYIYAILEDDWRTADLRGRSAR